MATARATRHRPTLVALVVAGLTLASCGGGSAAPPSQTAQVRSLWTSFFHGTTPASTRIAEAQDGTKLRTVITKLSELGVAKGLTASVASVVLTSPTTATVTYTLILDNTLHVVSGATGQAVKVAGTWVVGLQSICGLVQLDERHPADLRDAPRLITLRRSARRATREAPEPAQRRRQAALDGHEFELVVPDASGPWCSTSVVTRCSRSSRLVPTVSSSPPSCTAR